MEMKFKLGLGRGLSLGYSYPLIGLRNLPSTHVAKSILAYLHVVVGWTANQIGGKYFRLRILVNALFTGSGLDSKLDWWCKYFLEFGLTVCDVFRSVAHETIIILELWAED